MAAIRSGLSGEVMSPVDQRMAWNAVSTAYQKLHEHAMTSVSYSPWAPPESDLQLLGDVAGFHILDLGCGGGQNSVVLAQQSALVTGVDWSEMQIEHARRLAAANGVLVEFMLRNGEDLRTFDRDTYDVVFSSNTLPYIADMPRCLAGCAHVLRPGGRLVFSLDHPARACFFDEEMGEVLPYPTRSYFAESPIRWRFDGTQVRMESYHRTLATWVGLLLHAGFSLTSLVEPPPPTALLDDLWPEDDPRAPLRNLPHCAIFVAEKR